MHSIIKVFSLFLLSVLLMLAGCSQITKAHKERAFKIDYENYTLGNGLEVILHEDKSDPISSSCSVPCGIQPGSRGAHGLCTSF